MGDRPAKILILFVAIMLIIVILYMIFNGNSTKSDGNVKGTKIEEKAEYIKTKTGISVAKS